jgi:hypothetical protein
MFFIVALRREKIFGSAICKKPKAPVRPSIAVQYIEKANDLIAGLRAARQITRNGLSTLRIRVKRRLNIWCHRPAVSFQM